MMDIMKGNWITSSPTTVYPGQGGFNCFLFLFIFFILYTFVYSFSLYIFVFTISLGSPDKKGTFCLQT